MRVALVSQDFPPASYGGVASSCYDLAHNLANNGVDVRVFSTRKDHILGQSHDNVRVTWFPKYGSAPRLSLIANSSEIITNVSEANPDVIHTFGPYGSLINLLKKRTKKPILSSIHSVPYRGFRTFIHSPLSSWSLGDFASNFLEYPVSSMMMKTTLANSDHIVFPSLNCLADTLSSWSLPKNRFSVIINGIDFNAPYFRSPNGSPDEESQVIVYCGRLTWVKGILLLIRSFSMLTAKCPNATLKVIGGGSLDSHAKVLVSKLRLQKKIIFLGVLPREQAIKELRNAAFLALPSLSENCPVIVCEAMALRKPVVAFDYPFSRALIVHNHTGLLAPSLDVSAFSDQMSMLLTNGDKRKKLGENAYLHAKNKFDWSKNIKEYIRIYSALAKQ